MGKYGKKVEISLNPLAYNIGIIGESGIGKSTLIKEVCELIVGENGYIAFDIGKENGHSTISGMKSEPCEDWEKFDDVTTDIIENKSTDYPDLKVVVIDTVDQLFDIVEPEVIRLHNNEHRDKRITTINSAFGGYGKGLDKAIELTLDKLWELKKVGVTFIVIGHTKKREIEDVVTGQTYSTLTTNMSQKYFNAIKTKLDVLGVISIDREIIQEKTGKKEFKTNKEKTKGVIMSESRIITFRDDNYTIDSKSRFAQITDSIPLDAKAFVKAIQDAILAEHSKGAKTVEETQKQDAEKEIEKSKAVAAKNAEDKVANELKSIKEAMIEYVKENKGDREKIKPLLEKAKELGYQNPSKVDNLDDAKTLLELIA